MHRKYAVIDRLHEESPVTACAVPPPLARGTEKRNPPSRLADFAAATFPYTWIGTLLLTEYSVTPRTVSPSICKAVGRSNLTVIS